MKLKRIMAVTLTATMVIGSAMTVFAEDANSATGEGTSFDHVSQEVTSVTLPTTTQVENLFDYYVDPERLINDAGTLPDGTTVVAGNDDGVYFSNAGTQAVAGTVSYSIGSVTTGLTVTGVDTSKNEIYTYDGGESAWKDSESTVASIVVNDGNGDPVTPSADDTVTVSGAVAAGDSGYSSSSDAVTFEGRNSVAVDVSVAATVAAGEKNIALVSTVEELEAATSPALLLNLTVGSDTKAITDKGATASATIEGVPDNFAVTVDGGAYVYKTRTNTDEKALDPWNAVAVQLSGKTNEAEVPEGTAAMTAPNVTLTWTIAKHSTVKTGTGYGKFNASNETVWLALTNDSANGGIADASKLSNLKLAQGNGTSAACQFSYDANSKWFSVTWAQMRAAGVTWDATGTYNFTFDYDGVTYTAAVVPN